MRKWLGGLIRLPINALRKLLQGLCAKFTATQRTECLTTEHLADVLALTQRAESILLQIFCAT